MGGVGHDWVKRLFIDCEYTEEEKNAISHRGMANKKATDIIRQLQQETAGEINGTV